MDKQDPPTTFGVFKPVGHTLFAFATPAQLQTAMQELARMGFAPASMVQYSAPEMLSLAEGELLAAGPLANFGYELDLLRRHQALAQQGCGFLVVHAPGEALAARVATLVATLRPASAQHYGRFLIQDLTETAPGTA